MREKLAGKRLAYNPDLWYDMQCNNISIGEEALSIMTGQSAGGKLGIYIHIPFCYSKCAYCDFYSFVPKDPTIYERYTNALLSHMEYYKNAAYI